MNALDLENLIDDLVGVWWTDPNMRREVWAGLLACRTTLARCGYRTTSEEYETLTFLLALHHGINEHDDHKTN